MSDVEQKRAWIAAHPKWKSAAWRKKVMKMSDAQVIAIYMREHSKPKPKESKDDGGKDIPF